MQQNHERALEIMRDDDTFCRECGGWLGRKPGTRPHCTAWFCPGRTAPVSPPKRAQTTPDMATPARAALTPSPPPAFNVTPPPSAEKLRVEKFANRARDDEEKARIVRSAASRTREKTAFSSSPCNEYAMSALRTATFVTSIALLLVYIWWHLLGRAPVSFSLTSSHPFRNLVTLTPAQVTLLLLTGCALLGACYCKLAGYSVVRTIKYALAYGLMATHVVLILALALLVPYLPEPGAAHTHDVCVDLGSPGIRLDRTAVAAGPCFSFGIAFVQNDRATSPVAAAALAEAPTL